MNTQPGSSKNIVLAGENLAQDQIAKLSDKELYKRCRECAYNIRKFLKEFADYLPEVEKRRLYKKYGCHTLYEFAAKLAGMTKNTVDDILNVHTKLDDKPALQALISEQGWSKLKVVATVATAKTQTFWAEKVQTMSKETLKTFVKELRRESHEVLNGEQSERPVISGLEPNEQMTESLKPAEEGLVTWPEPSKQMAASQKSGGIHSMMAAKARRSSAFAIRLDDDIETQLRIFKHRLEKENGELLDWNQTMKALLKIVDEHGVCTKLKKKNRLKEPSDVSEKEEIQKSLPSIDKRHIPARVKRYLEGKYHGRCAFPGCKSPSEIYHHTRRFLLEPNHDPDYIVPLCKQHERLVHHGLIANEELPPENWKILLEPDKKSPKYFVDRRVQRYRMDGD